MSRKVAQPTATSTLARSLRSPRLALSVLCFTMLYTAAVSWLPWLSSAASAPPHWAKVLGLEHPFRSTPFLLACSLLFINTLACTWDRFGRVRGLWRGELPPWANVLPGAGAAVLGVLEQEGFRARGGIYFKNRFALWGGFILHLGILAVILSVAAQQAFYEGGSFEIAQREMVSLDAPGVVFNREAGPLAPKGPPGLRVALDSFEADLHQKGYAPDRLSRLTVLDPAHPGREVSGTIDRSRGLGVGETTIYQAIPTGYTLNLETQGLGVRSIHLRGEKPTAASAVITDPAGERVRFILESQRALSDPQGPGRLDVRLERRGSSGYLTQGVPFPFGTGVARITGVSRWGGFTYARTAGTGLVFAGFGIGLVGCFLLLFPSGVARLEEGADGARSKVYLSRGIELLRLEWEKTQGERAR